MHCSLHHDEQCFSCSFYLPWSFACKLAYFEGARRDLWATGRLAFSPSPSPSFLCFLVFFLEILCFEKHVYRSKQRNSESPERENLVAGNRYSWSTWLRPWSQVLDSSSHIVPRLLFWKALFFFLTCLQISLAVILHSTLFWKQLYLPLGTVQHQVPVVLLMTKPRISLHWQAREEIVETFLSCVLFTEPSILIFKSIASALMEARSWPYFDPNYETINMRINPPRYDHSGTSLKFYSCEHLCVFLSSGGWY